MLYGSNAAVSVSGFNISLTDCRLSQSGKREHCFGLNIKKHCEEEYFMKKIKSIFILILMVLCVVNLCVYAEVNYESLSEEEEVKNHFSIYTYIYEVNGVPYKEIRPIDLNKDESRVLAKRYDEGTENKLIEACGYDTEYPLNISYIHENGIYVVINLDNGWPWHIWFPNTKLYYCDENFNLLGTEDFGGDIYIYNIGYANGTYYCQYKEMINKVKNSDGTITEERERYHYTEHRLIDTRDVIMKSNDLKEWVQTDEEVPKSNGEAVIQGDKISRDGKESLRKIVYETDKGKYIANVGKYIVYMKYDDKTTLYFSNDGVYFINVEPKDMVAEVCMNSVDNWTMHILNGKIYINDTLKINEADIEKELNELKQNTVAYVVLNDSILSFDQPPVIEEGHTLVPMRFLFEQMWANVEWNEETKSARAVLNNKAVTFAIDDNKAEVDSQPVTMDVPARLINGKTMVPLRFLSERLGYTVTWDEETRTAVVE